MTPARLLFIVVSSCLLVLSNRVGAASQTSLRSGAAHVEVVWSEGDSFVFDFSLQAEATTYAGTVGPVLLVWSNQTDPKAARQPFLEIEGASGALAVGETETQAGLLDLTIGLGAAPAIPYSSEAGGICQITWTLVDPNAAEGRFDCEGLPGPFDRDGTIDASGSFVASSQSGAALPPAQDNGGALSPVLVLVLGGLAISAVTLFLFRRRARAVPPGHPSAEPGWYSDPWGQARLRYFDGTSWTQHTSP
jgi:hypothetical protein